MTQYVTSADVYHFSCFQFLLSYLGFEGKKKATGEASAPEITTLPGGRIWYYTHQHLRAASWVLAHTVTTVRWPLTHQLDAHFSVTVTQETSVSLLAEATERETHVLQAVMA